MFVVTDKFHGINELKLIPCEIKKDNDCSLLAGGNCPFMRGGFKSGVKPAVMCQAGFNYMIECGCVEKYSEVKDEA